MRDIKRMGLKDGFDVECLLDQLKPNWELVEHDLHDISRRLREYDPTYFLLYNHRTGKTEVHNTENVGNTYCFSNPFDELDQRLIDKVEETDIQRIGAKVRMMQIEEEERLLELAKEKELKDTASNVAQETHYHFKAAFKNM